MLFNKSIVIGNTIISPDSSSYIIAEIGSNHNGDLNIALEAIEAAKEAAVNAVKFQTFRASSHYSKYSPGFTYLDNIDIYELIHKNELNREWHSQLQKKAQQCGLDFFSSACDFEAVDELNNLNVPAFKVASFDIPDLDLISYTAKKGKPIILSTGMCSIFDISKALEVCNRENNNDVVLLQCTSLYPAPKEIANLNAIKKMAEYFGILVGYSDHTGDDLCAIAAIALGAKVFEKHFTLSRDMDGPDHPFAMDPSMMKNYVKSIRLTEEALGTGQKWGPHPKEREMFEKGRRSLHVARTLKPGDVISEKDLITKRPGYGIPPYLKEYIIGKVAKTDIQEDHWISWEMI
jgi:sialic acid synthase SpsE